MREAKSRSLRWIVRQSGRLFILSICGDLLSLFLWFVFHIAFGFSSAWFSKSPIFLRSTWRYELLWSHLFAEITFGWIIYAITVRAGSGPRGGGAMLMTTTGGQTAYVPSPVYPKSPEAIEEDKDKQKMLSLAAFSFGLLIGIPLLFPFCLLETFDEVYKSSFFPWPVDFYSSLGQILRFIGGHPGFQYTVRVWFSCWAFALAASFASFSLAYWINRCGNGLRKAFMYLVWLLWAVLAVNFGGWVYLISKHFLGLVR